MISLLKNDLRQEGEAILILVKVGVVEWCELFQLSYAYKLPAS